MLNDIEKSDIKEILDDLDTKLLCNKVFLITGATGSLARYIALSLLEFYRSNPHCAGKVILSARNEDKIKDIFSDYFEYDFFQYITGNVETKISYEGNIDYIIHAACVSNSNFFSTNPVEIISANTVGTYQLLEFAKEKKVKAFLFFSSGAVYGGITLDDYSYNGIDPLNSKNCYAISKKMGENLCASFFDEYNLNAKIVRIGYTYGPHIDFNDGHLYSDFIRAIYNRETLIIRGNPQKRIGLCYVTDAVRAFFKVLFEGTAKTPYVMRNITNVMTIQELAECLTNKVFKDKNLQYICNTNGSVDNTEFRKPELLYWLGWKPRISIEEGFKRVLTSMEGY